MTVVSYERRIQITCKWVGFEPPELIIRPFTVLHFPAFICSDQTFIETEALSVLLKVTGKRTVCSHLRDALVVS